MQPAQRTWLPWLSLAIASSPAIVGLARQLAQDPPRRYVLFALLTIVLQLLLRDPVAEAPPRRLGRAAGWLSLSAGLGAQLVGIATSSAFIANVGLPLAGLGVGLILGRPRLEALLLGFGIVPIPGFLLAIGSPTLETWLCKGLGSVLGALGASVEAVGPLMTDRGRRFEFRTADAGFVTLVCAVQFGWDRAVRARMGFASIVRSALVAGSIGLVVQPGLLLLCAATLPLGFPDLGRFVLSFGVPIALGLAALGGRIRRPRP